jgi:D-sedoheptulose 7-phosphate isomerase
METTIRQRIREHTDAVARLDDSHVAAIAAAAELLNECFDAGGAVYICGNGGSAADAQHIACELVGRFLCDRRALPAVALTTDTSILTAVGNDFGFEPVFARQAEALVRPGDVLWALSTSGNSTNIMAAAKVARRLGGRVLGFVGGDGGTLTELTDVCFRAPATGSFAVQQIHQIAYHLICELVEAHAAGDEGRTD